MADERELIRRIDARDFSAAIFEDVDLLLSEPHCFTYHGCWLDWLTEHSYFSLLPQKTQELYSEIRSGRRPKKSNKPIEEPIIERLLISFRTNAPIPDGLATKHIIKPLAGHSDQTTPLHIAAAWGKLNALPKELLSEQIMLVKDSNGNSPLHRAMSRKALHLVPQFLITPVTLAAARNDGTRVIDLLFSKGLEDCLALDLLQKLPEYREWQLLKAVKGRDTQAEGLQDTSLLRMSPSTFKFDGTLCHWLASQGWLRVLSENVLLSSVLVQGDSMGRTPLHLYAEKYGISGLPEFLLSYDRLAQKDRSGTSVFHLLAVLADFGGLVPDKFTKSALLLSNQLGTTVADLIEEYSNTGLLPHHLRWLTRDNALREIQRQFIDHFENASLFLRDFVSEVVSENEFRSLRRRFVQEWAIDDKDWKLDEEQADAVAEYGPHIQVTARAGSGKTRTLVARALFQIQHCRIPASSILILAFNKKAVEEIRERLSKMLSEEQMPHVLTFHALAHRIVKPQEDLIYDEGDTKAGQVFSTTIQRIIDEQMRGGPFEAKLRELMEARWNVDLNRIIEFGFNLHQEEFLEHRANLPRTTMNGRRVDTEAHKHIGNVLLRLGLSYSYRRDIHRTAGAAYAPDFSHYQKETDQWLLIEVLGETVAQANSARQAFWKSDRSANAHLLQITEADCQDPDVMLGRLTKKLSACGITVSPMRDDELWLLLRDDVIRDFTKAVRGFISRCQKELISPDRLDGMLPDTDPELWSIIQVEKGFMRMPNIRGLQVRFWRLCSEIYKRYRQVLAEAHQTDFDQLMLDAAGMIRAGRTGFKSARGSGDICQIRHLLIDEFQDFSHLFDELRKSIAVQSPDANFFCVGDDWQAINKFAGSDLRYFTGFREAFEPSVRKLITRNYRSCREIVEIGNRVMDGQGEPSIANSSTSGKVLRVEVGGYHSLSEAEEIVVEELGEDALAILRIASHSTSKGDTVAVLSRTSSIATSEGMLKLEKWQDALRRFLPEKQRGLLAVSTTHGYKGKEADVVILLDPEAYPFVHPDSVFTTIFGDTLESIRDDERRLFYVGVTRPRRTLFLLSYPSRYSETRPYRIRFLEGHYPPAFNINRLQSSLICGSRVIVKLANRLGTSGIGGTYPIKDRLKSAGYKWNEENKTWSIFLEEGSINSPFECRQFLLRQPWIGDADGVLASFAWGDQQHLMRIVGGKVIPGTVPGKAISDTVPAKVAPDTVQDELVEAYRYAGEQRYSEPDYDVEEYLLATDSPVHFMHDEGPPKQVAVSTGVFETPVAGMRYEGRMRKAEHLAVGNFVRLEREPGNTHDRNAIKVVTAEGVHIGYISRQVAAHLAADLDSWGGTWQAKVSSVWSQPYPHFLVSIQICFPLPPGIVIPRDLGASPALEDSPFDSAEPKPREYKSPGVVPADPIVTSVPTPTEPEHRPPCSTTPDFHRPVHEIPFNFEGLSPSQRADLENLLEARLGPLIAELYLTGCSDWPEIGYEGRDSAGRCTGSMLEVAWLDFKIGIAVQTNDYRSFAEAGWTIFPAATVTASELRDQFVERTEPTTPTRAVPSTQSDRTGLNADKNPAHNEFTDTNIHFQHGQFFDEDPDDDVPF